MRDTVRRDGILERRHDMVLSHDGVPFLRSVFTVEGLPFPREVIEALPNLKLLMTSGMRNASFDLDATKERGITVCATGGVGNATAGLTIGLMLELTRHIGYENARMHAGEPWQTTMGRDIARCLEEDVPIPNLVGVRLGAQTMQVAAMNDLHKGDLEQAVQDLRTLLSFAKLYEQDPSLVNYMIRMAIIALSTDVCWDALQADGWTEPQLATLQQECLDSGRMLPQMARAMESERAGRLYGWQLFRSHSYQQWLARYQEL